MSVKTNVRNDTILTSINKNKTSIPIQISDSIISDF